MPENSLLPNSGKGSADVVQIFLKSKKELEEQLPKLKTSVSPKGIIWVTYPKGTSSMKSDINRDVIRVYADGVGLEVVAIFSVDDDWLALRLKIVQ